MLNASDQIKRTQEPDQITSKRGYVGNMIYDYFETLHVCIVVIN